MCRGETRSAVNEMGYALNNALSPDILLSFATFSALNSPSPACFPFRAVGFFGFGGPAAFALVRLGAVGFGIRGFFGAGIDLAFRFVGTFACGLEA